MTRRRRLLLVLAAAVASVAVVGVVPGEAQLLGPPGSTTTTAPPPSETTTTTSTTAPPSTTTTTSPSILPTDPDPGSPPPEDPDDGDPGDEPGAEDPGDGDAPAEEPSTAPDGAFDPGPGEEGEAPAEDADRPAPRSVPPEAQVIINSVNRSPANNSAALDEAVRELVDLGLSIEEARRIGFGRFPVAGVARYSHDWLYPRYGPGFRFHLGTDVFAAYGTPLRSPVDGTVTAGTGNLGGLYAKIFMDDGTYFYYAHLSALPEGFVDGMSVKTGDIVGYVGDSGNAKGGSPHLHIGIYPQGGPAVDPKPILDQMLADAMAALPDIVAAVRVNRDAAIAAEQARAAASPLRAPRALLATELLRPITDAGVRQGVNATVLLEAVGNAGAGGLAVAEAEASALVADIDWDEWERRADRAADVVERADRVLGEALGALGWTLFGDA